jgi:ABC-2 type transport system ATP-binding protein
VFSERKTLMDEDIEMVENREKFIIITHGLSKMYGDVTALRSLDLRIPEYSICGFLGLNGAGKSTAIKLLLGLARPTSGAGSIFGYDIKRESIAVRRHVGYLAQDSHFYDHMTARETLRFVAHFFYTGPHKAIEDRIAETLDLVGLTEKADRSIVGFSGGERQRLGIAQAQINNPRLLILDEPAAALDPIGRRDVLEVMQRLRGRTTIFYSTHLLDDVQRVSDMVAILHKGALIAQAPIDTLLTHNDAITYELILHGDVAHAHERLSQQLWITHIQEVSTLDPVIWHVTVSDEKLAQAHLLSIATADGQVQVVGFGRRKHELEDMFVRLIEEGSYANR